MLAQSLGTRLYFIAAKHALQVSVRVLQNGVRFQLTACDAFLSYDSRSFQCAGADWPGYIFRISSSSVSRNTIG